MVGWSSTTGEWQFKEDFSLKPEVYGDRRVLSNPFHCDRVELNLPGSKGYRSDLSWVMNNEPWDPHSGHCASQPLEKEGGGKGV